MPTSPRPTRYTPHREPRSPLNCSTGRKILSLADFSGEALSARRRKKSRRLLIMITACWGIACMIIVLDSTMGTRHPFPPGRYPAPVPDRAIYPPDSSFLARTGPVAGARHYLDSLCSRDPERYLGAVTTGIVRRESSVQVEYNLSQQNP